MHRVISLNSVHGLVLETEVGMLGGEKYTLMEYTSEEGGGRQKIWHAKIYSISVTTEKYLKQQTNE